MVTIDVPQLAYEIQMTDPFYFLTTVNASFSRPIVFQPIVQDDSEVVFFQASPELNFDLAYMSDIRKSLFPDSNSHIPASELWKSVIFDVLEERSSLPILILSEYIQNSNSG